MNKAFDEYFMRMALREAEKAAADGEVPTGCVIVDVAGLDENAEPTSARILARAHNMPEQLKDATAHAEMLALTAAAGAKGAWRLAGTRLYVTKEPCPMCAGALCHAHIGKVVWAADDPKNGFSRFGNMLHPKTKTETGVMHDECLALLTEFFKKKR